MNTYKDGIDQNDDGAHPKKIASRCQGTAASCPNHPDFRSNNNTLPERETKFYKYCPSCYIAIQRAMMPRPLSPQKISMSLDNLCPIRSLDASVSPPSHRARPKKWGGQTTEKVNLIKSLVCPQYTKSRVLLFLFYCVASGQLPVGWRGRKLSMYIIRVDSVFANFRCFQ